MDIRNQKKRQKHDSLMTTVSVLLTAGATSEWIYLFTQIQKSKLDMFFKRKRKKKKERKKKEKAFFNVTIHLFDTMPCLPLRAPQNPSLNIAK